MVVATHAVTVAVRVHVVTPVCQRSTAATVAAAICAIPSPNRTTPHGLVVNSPLPRVASAYADIDG
jgi:hypothetical protein